jgi:hypothetical protein
MLLIRRELLTQGDWEPSGKSVFQNKTKIDNKTNIANRKHVVQI